MGRKTFKKNSPKKNNLPRKHTPSQQKTPQIVPNQQNQPSFMGNIAQGATLGAGMAMGSEMIRGLFGLKNQELDSFLIDDVNDLIKNGNTNEVKIQIAKLISYIDGSNYDRENQHKL